MPWITEKYDDVAPQIRWKEGSVKRVARYRRVGGITLDTSDRTVSAVGPYELMLGQIRTRGFFTPRELLIQERPDTVRATVYRLHVFIEPGEIRQISEDGVFEASYDVFSGEWSFRRTSTRRVRSAMISRISRYLCGWALLSFSLYGEARTPFGVHTSFRLWEKRSIERRIPR